ncbi:glycosyltransferase family 4 protein [Paludicola sp. MB14-C6]|uniref:glycosyltransferase family 4 protein n=1 Tax=Paludihabitans sp. MB14-C6 TaxID=3070656 RepID=UPI0027DE9489|nr:glycosyltransferase family 4 protein [Paludicola sp. MB14-C6]WMJ22938.1 glycosyltransferase family 4 protein [Paludicola sp. MB14-C6]
MKVLFITNFEAPYRIDFYNELTNYMDLTVAFFDSKEQQKGRCSEWFVEVEYKFNHILLKQSKFLNGHICYGVKELVLDKSYDLIMLDSYCEYTGMYAIKQLKKYDIPFVLEADGGFAKSGKGFKELLKKKLISSATWWIGTGEATTQYLEFYGAKRENTYSYPFTTVAQKDIVTGLITKEEKQVIKQEFGITEEKVILNVGQFIPLKANDILIQACKNLDKSIGIYLVGGKPTQEYLDLKDKYGLSNLHFIDFMVKDELIKYYKAADVFCFPTRGDVWGLVVNEAMAQGLSVITTDRCIAGLELIKDEENGYIVPVDDVKAFTEKLNIILNNDDLAKTMSQNNIEKIKQYTIENMAIRHKEIFDDILKSKGK